MMKNRVEIHREMARCMYEPQMTAYQQGGMNLQGAWSAGGEVHEPWTVTTFGPLVGEARTTITGEPNSMDATPEFQMYWTGIPDFRVTDYKIFPNEEGWIARITYGGTSRVGTSVVAHEVDIVTTDDQERVVRIEWFIDTPQWHQIWSQASGLSLEDVQAMLAKPAGLKQIIDYTLSRPRKG
jgi:hypothetical protein